MAQIGREQAAPLRVRIEIGGRAQDVREETRFEKVQSPLAVVQVTVSSTLEQDRDEHQRQTQQQDVVRDVGRAEGEGGGFEEKKDIIDRRLLGRFKEDRT